MRPAFIDPNVRPSPHERVAVGRNTQAGQALKIISNKLRERMADTASVVTSGTCADFAEYRHLCGVLQGLGLAEREILDLTHTMESADED